MRRALVGFATLAALYLVVALTTGAASPRLPAGYRPINGDVGYRWTTGSCGAPNPGGCWHALFLVPEGCSGGMSAMLSESRAGVVVGDVVASTPPIAPGAPTEVEFDADTGGPLSGTIAQANCS
jgi:hypothetical protein